jgi:CBS domain-containing protein
MAIDYDDPEQTYDEEYFATSRGERTTGRFDVTLLREPIGVLHTRVPLVFSPKDSASEAMRAMQSEHRGSVLITEDGSRRSRLQGIFTERDVLRRVIDGGRNPAQLAVGEIMTPDPECLHVHAPVAWALNKMEVGGFRHVPAVDDEGRPQLVVSVKDIVT